jgi:hypothetical protein
MAQITLNEALAWLKTLNAQPAKAGGLDGATESRSAIQ